MAGYDWRAGMSVNAVSAYRSGLAPASVWARRLGVTAKEIAYFCDPSEWHHTSKFFNPTNFYSWEDVLVGLRASLNPTTLARRRLWLRLNHEACALDVALDDGSEFYVCLEALHGLS